MGKQKVMHLNSTFLRLIPMYNVNVRLTSPPTNVTCKAMSETKRGMHDKVEIQYKKHFPFTCLKISDDT